MRNKKLGLYIHIPFCIKKCAYCDFYSLEGGKDDKYIKYSERIAKQIKKIGEALSNCTFDSIYFGGGTPSLIGISGFNIIFEAIDRFLSVDKGAEISVEVNPKTVDAKLAIALFELGVNRISIGLQSANDNELLYLSRIHTFDDFKRTHSVIKEHLTDNINADIMLGIPNQTVKSLSFTLESLIALSLPHISAYMLKIEKGTPFYKMSDLLPLPDEEQVCDMYEYLCKTQKSADIPQYEISNFAKVGFECRHNLKYWERGEYVGLGPSAHSFINGIRYSYPRDLVMYMSLDSPPYEEYRILSGADIRNEEIMLGLRLKKGIIPDARLFDIAKKYINGGFMEYKDGRLFFTTKGFLVSNYIISELIE